MMRRMALVLSWSAEELSEGGGHHGVVYVVRLAVEGLVMRAGDGPGDLYGRRCQGRCRPAVEHESAGLDGLQLPGRRESEIPDERVVGDEAVGLGFQSGPERCLPHA